MEVRVSTDGKKLIYHRRFDWGRQNKLLMSAKAYPQVKSVFDFVQEQDGYTIALKAVGDAH